MRIFSVLGRRINRVDPDTRKGMFWGSVFILGAALIAFIIFAWIKLDNTSTSANNAALSTNNLLKNGETSGAKKLNRAASVDLQLLCLVLEPAVKGKSNPAVTQRVRQIVESDCKDSV